MEAHEQTAALLAVARKNQDVEATELAAAVLIDGLTQKIATAQEELCQAKNYRIGMVKIRSKEVWEQLCIKYILN